MIRLSPHTLNEALVVFCAENCRVDFPKKKKIQHKLNSIPYWRDHVYKAEENPKHWYMIYLLWVVVWCAGRAVRFDRL